jgi:hypothetical protein
MENLETNPTENSPEEPEKEFTEEELEEIKRLWSVVEDLKNHTIEKLFGHKLTKEVLAKIQEALGENYHIIKTEQD